VFGIYLVCNFVNVRTLNIFLFVLVLSNSKAQSFLRVIQPMPASNKTYELYVSDAIEYKLKGEHKFKRDRILNINDSLLLLEKDSIIKIAQIKAFRFRRSDHLLGTLNAVCFIGGAGYMGLNVINNGLLNNTLALDKRALYIGAGFITAGIILTLVRTKHVRIRKNTSLKVLPVSNKDLGR
jgi:hypothetical protein